MMNHIINAINSKKCLKLIYNDFERIVEPHAYGQSTDLNDVLRIWQVSGGSRSGNPSKWRLFRVDQIRDMILVDLDALMPRSGYKKNDKAMRRIYAEI